MLAFLFISLIAPTTCSATLARATCVRDEASLPGRGDVAAGCAAANVIAEAEEYSTFCDDAAGAPCRCCRRLRRDAEADRADARARDRCRGARAAPTKSLAVYTVSTGPAARRPPRRAARRTRSHPRRLRPRPRAAQRDGARGRRRLPLLLRRRELPGRRGTRRGDAVDGRAAAAGLAQRVRGAAPPAAGRAPRRLRRPVLRRLRVRRAVPLARRQAPAAPLPAGLRGVALRRRERPRRAPRGKRPPVRDVPTARSKCSRSVEPTSIRPMLGRIDGSRRSTAGELASKRSGRSVDSFAGRAARVAALT